MLRDVFLKSESPMALWLTAIVGGAVILAVSCSDSEKPFQPPVYIFDGPAEETVLPISRTAWHIAAEPYELDGEGYGRGRLLWHTPRELRPYESIWDDEAPPGENAVRTLRFIFRPVGSGTKSWGGVTTFFDKAIPDSIDYFDVRVLGDHGLIHLNFGRVCEDVNDDGFAFSEDLDGNGAVDHEEDVGLDGIADGQGEEPTPWGTDDDPAGDNWYFRGDGKCPFGNGCDTIDWESDEWYFEFLNGTEGNIHDPAVAGIPDAERLSEGVSLQTYDRYFSWVIDLANNDYVVEGSEFMDWRTLRLPIREGSVIDTVTEVFSLPTWQDIRHVRIWLEADESQTAPDTVEIADWRFIKAAD